MDVLARPPERPAEVDRCETSTDLIEASVIGPQQPCGIGEYGLDVVADTVCCHHFHFVWCHPAENAATIWRTGAQSASSGSREHGGITWTVPHYRGIAAPFGFKRYATSYSDELRPIDHERVTITHACDLPLAFRGDRRHGRPSSLALSARIIHQRAGFRGADDVLAAAPAALRHVTG